MKYKIEYDENTLVQLLIAKDQIAFTYLYMKYATAIKSVIHKIITNPNMVEDICQDVFLKIWNNFPKYDNTKGRLYTWMLNITKNTCIDTLRNKCYKQYMRITNDLDGICNHVSANATSTVKYDIIGIRERLKQLNHNQRNILDLIYFNGYSQAEISQETGVPLGTVKTRTRAGLIKLKALLQAV